MRAFRRARRSAVQSGQGETLKAASPVTETIAARAPRPLPASVVPKAEPMPAPDAAIATAREAARTAASLEILRDMLENFDGCALKSTDSVWCLPTATRRPVSCSSARRRDATRISRACPLSDARQAAGPDDRLDRA